MYIFEDFCYHQHDEVCNQTYGGDLKLPYSFHLKQVVGFAARKGFVSLLAEKLGVDFYDALTLASMAAAGHDLIEDARLTYNDVRNKCSGFVIKEGDAVLVADAIYGCTESTGRNRDERHDDAYYERLTASPLAVYTKLCDLMANQSFSLATNSSMLKKYRQEWKKFCDETLDYFVDYAPMYQFIESIHNSHKILNQ